MKKTMAICLLLALALTLTGCLCRHQWVEADCLNPKICTKCGETEGQALGHSWQEVTCEAPKTCATCGKTEGEALGHSWQDATCEAPETCAACGLTQGEALGHSWKEANYQDPETCTTCGATQAEPLQASFEAHGISINLWENRQDSTDETDPVEGFSYMTTCNSNKSKKTEGKLFLSNYRIVPSDETHPALDGYEWRLVDAQIEFSDSNAYSYGVVVRHSVENYYNIEDWDLSLRDFTGTPWEKLNKKNAWVNCFTVSCHGEDYPVFAGYENENWSRWQTRTNPTDGTRERYMTYTATFSACVPVGYDGVVVGFVDSGPVWADDAYIYEKDLENALFFRMENLESGTP